jgi:hypothetical protein
LTQELRTDTQEPCWRLSWCQPLLNDRYPQLITHILICAWSQVRVMQRSSLPFCIKEWQGPPPPPNAYPFAILEEGTVNAYGLHVYRHCKGCSVCKLVIKYIYNSIAVLHTCNILIAYKGNILLPISVMIFRHTRAGLWYSIIKQTFYNFYIHTIK